jgi:hypothetical protein
MIPHNQASKLLLFIFIGLISGSLTFAQEVPPDPEDPPSEVPDFGDLTPPDGIPTSLLPRVLFTPALGEEKAKIFFFYTPQTTSSGRFELSTDLETWTPVTTATQTSGLTGYAHEVEEDEAVYLRWRTYP